LMLNLIISYFLEFLSCLCLIIICMWYGFVIYVNLDDRVMGIIKQQKNPITGPWINQHKDN